MADDDNLDLDLYGEDETQDEQNHDGAAGGEAADKGGENGSRDSGFNEEANDAAQGSAENNPMDSQQDGDRSHSRSGAHGDSNGRHDDRPVDPNASTAIQISDLQWYVNDNDIRGWARACGSEDELKDITFSEHKVNGKSRGQVFLEFTTAQASTALKTYLENPPAADDHHPNPPKRHAVVFKTPGLNPFHTLPKDAPNRGKADAPGASRGAYNQSGAPFRGRGGRGGGGFKPNNNFNGGGGGGWMPGYNGGRGGFNNGGGGGFGMPMRGGGGGRGGRGGMNPMPMMPAMMGMPGMMPGIGMPGFGAQGFNPAFFGGGAGGGMGGAPPQQQQGGGGEWNPHGAKRLRPE